MKCLYISSTRQVSTPYQDGSTRYRCYNFVEELVKLKYSAHVAPITAVNAQLLTQYDVAVFLRPQMSKELLELVEICAQKNIIAVADYDDLLFRPDMADQSPSVLAGRTSVEQMKKTFTSHRDALRLFNRVTVATQSLRQHVIDVTDGHDTEIHHLPNGLSSWWLNNNKQYNFRDRRQNHLLYMPGSRSHDHDFNAMADTFQSLLGSGATFRLKVIGPLAIDHDILDPEFLIRGPVWVDFDHLPAHISRAKACLAPLADSAFNRCKSHIKFIEAAAFGTPLLATAIPDMEQHTVEGLFFPRTLSDWREYTTRLCDTDFVNHCSESLYDYARNNCSNELQLPALLSFFSGHPSTPSIDTRSGVDKNRLDKCRSDYSPVSVTLGSGNNHRPQNLSSLKRKYRKLRQSPKHFFLDSKLCSFYRHRKFQ